MQTRNKAVILMLAIVIIASLGAAYWGHSRSRAESSAERKALYYQDSMHPWIKSDAPGKCPVCDMALTAIYGEDQGFAMREGLVVLNSNNITVMNVQTEEVKRRSLSRSFRVAGTLEANETRKSIVSAPARGRIDVLNVDYVGVEVERGQKLMTMFSPELVQLRKTLLAVRQIQSKEGSNSATKANVDPGLYTGDILAPDSGVVLERNVYLGQYVTEGDRLLVLADASTLWFRFDVYERQLAWFDVGQRIEVRVEAASGKVFPAVITFIEPGINEATRAVKVRADIPNPARSNRGRQQRALRFGMFAEGLVCATVTNVLVVPRSAVLLPGRVACAYVDQGGGAFERRILKLGLEGDECWEVLGGIEEGERVVTSGNVLMDAHARFNGESEHKDGVSQELGTEPVGMKESSEDVTSHVVADQAATMMAQPSGEKGIVPTSAGLTNTAVSRSVSYSKLANAGRSERMAAICSPGSELQLIRRNTILAELAEAATNMLHPVSNQLKQSFEAAGQVVSPAADQFVEGKMRSSQK